MFGKFLNSVETAIMKNVCDARKSVRSSRLTSLPQVELYTRQQLAEFACSNDKVLATYSIGPGKIAS